MKMLQKFSCSEGTSNHNSIKLKSIYCIELIFFLKIGMYKTSFASSITAAYFPHITLT